MKKLTAGLTAAALASSVLAVTPVQAATAPTVCLVDGREATYKKANYPGVDGPVESIATSGLSYHKFEDGVYARNSNYRPSNVTYFTPTTYSDWTYGVMTWSGQDRINRYIETKASTDGAIRECLSNVVTEYNMFYEPVEFQVDRPANIPGAGSQTTTPAPSTTTTPAPSTTTTPAPSTTNSPSPEPTEPGSSEAVGGLAILAVIAAIIATLGGFAGVADALPFAL